MLTKLDTELMQQLMLMFRTELDEQLQSLTEGLLALEKGNGGAEYEKCLDGLFRAAHNIKGAARGVDVRDVAAISHSLETLFGTLRRDKSTVNPQTIDLCLLSLDHMREALDAFESQQALTFDLPAFLAQLDMGRESTGASVEQRAAPVANESAVTTQAQATGPSTNARNDPAAAPETSTTRQETEVTRVTLSKLERISALVEDLLATKIEMQDHLVAIQRLHEETQSFVRKWTQLVPTLKREGKFGPTSGVRNSLATTTDAINNLCTGSQRIYKQMRATNNRITLTSGMLQDQVRMIRLVPVATLLRPLARSVRDIAHELGKQIDYQVSGDDIEIDRPILEGIKDSLVHLLRNAVDHGIESQMARRAQGKPEVGRISVTVSATGNRIMLAIQDDGIGISAARIAGVAVRKKLLSATEAELLSPEETLNLIFRPGFSSKEIITNISGRGVGLDVVVSSLRNLKGSVHVDTLEGKGTTFTLSLPLTLSTDHGLMVRTGGTIYAIPTSAVDRVMKIRASDLVDIQAGQAVVVDGKAIPVCDLAALLELGQSLTDAREQLSLVVVTKDWQSIALLVEEIIGEREIVIKRLQPPLIAVRNVTGGTLTGSGEVVIVLNPTDLVSSALRLGTATRVRSQCETVTEPPHVLLVDDSITTRTLEKNILESRGYRVIVAVDGQLGWEAMQKEKFDLVVTDVEMPRMNGFELAAQIKGSEQFRETPVVIVTSLASEADRRRGIEVGADAYIVKGEFETKALLDVIEQLI